MKITKQSAAKAKKLVSRPRRREPSELEQTLMPHVDALEEGQCVAAEGVDPKDVSRIRAFINSHKGEAFRVRSVRERDADTYLVVIGRRKDLRTPSRSESTHHTATEVGDA